MPIHGGTCRVTIAPRRGAIWHHILLLQQAVRELDQDTFDRRRRVLGDDHPDTSNSAGNFAAQLHAPGASDNGG